MKDEGKSRRPLPEEEKESVRIEKKCNGTFAETRSIWKMNSCMTRSIIAIRQKGRETYLPLKGTVMARNSLYDSFRRLDILRELLDDKEVTEIMINGAGKIFIEKKGEMILWHRRFEKNKSS